MLITIGQKPSAARDLVDLLLECHERIRSFVALARAAAEEADPPETEIVEACFRVERYFVEALPLHVADEEESVLPRLGGRSLEIDRALHAMHEQHIGHERKLRSLLNASAALRQSPSDVRRRAVLAVAASDLGQDLTEHLALEEAVVFPTISRVLPAATQAEIVAELRARRRRDDRLSSASKERLRSSVASDALDPRKTGK